MHVLSKKQQIYTMIYLKNKKNYTMSFNYIFVDTFFFCFHDIGTKFSPRLNN